MSGAWKHIARRHLSAAGELLEKEYFRSSVNRAYYSAFAAVTHELEQEKVTFPQGREAPPHGKVRQLIESQMPKLELWKQRDLKRLVKVLYDLRCQADYSRRTRIDSQVAREALNEAILAHKHLGTMG